MTQRQRLPAVATALTSPPLPKNPLPHPPHPPAHTHTPVCCEVLHCLPEALRLHWTQRVATNSTEYKAEVIRHLQDTAEAAAAAQH
jgi:hypothetical protein